MECAFCSIIAHEIPARIIHENEEVIAFLDHDPATPGHTLVVPKRHRVDLFDATDAELAALVNMARRIGQSVRTALGAQGVKLHQVSGDAAGQDVFHLHFHVIPRYENDTIQPSWGAPPWRAPDLSEGDLDKVARRLGDGLAR